MVGQFTASYTKRGKWYVGFVQEVPGVNTQGKTLKEAKENLKEALIMVLEVNRELLKKERPKGRLIREPIAVTA